MALKEAKSELDSTRSKLEGGQVVEGVGETIRNSRAAKLAAYDKQASLYLETVYQGRREVLIEQLDEFCTTLKKAQLANLMTRHRKRTEEELGSAVADILNQAKPDAWEKVGQQVTKYLATSTKALQPAVEGMGFEIGR